MLTYYNVQARQIAISFVAVITLFPPAGLILSN